VLDAAPPHSHRTCLPYTTLFRSKVTEKNVLADSPVASACKENGETWTVRSLLVVAPVTVHQGPLAGPRNSATTAPSSARKSIRLRSPNSRLCQARRLHLRIISYVSDKCC